MNGQPGPNGLSLEEVEALMDSDDDEALVESLRLAEEKNMDIDDEHEVMLATSPLENASSMVVTPPTPATDMEQQGQGFDISFIPFRHRTSHRYGITRDTFRLRWTSPNELHDALEPEEFARQLLNALFEGVQRHIQQFDPNDFLQVYMASNRLQHNYTSHRVRVRDWLASSAPAEGLLTHLQNVLNSNQNFEPDDTFVFDVTQIRDPRGGGRRKLGSTDYVNLLKKKKSVIVIKNDDVLCCARALVTAKARHEQDQSVDALRKYQALRDGRPIQEHCARELHKAARVPIGTCGLGEIQLFEIVLAPCQLVVVSADHGNSIIYKGPPHDKQLILLLKGNHYDVITSLEGYFARKYFCLECEKGFDHNDYRHHQCPGSKCYACHQTTCEAFKLYRGRSAETSCDSCGRRFFGQDCYLKHCTFNDKGEVAQPSKRDSVCQTHRKCSECGRTLMGSKDIREHQCGRQPCPSCERVVNLWQHKCYIQPVSQKNKRKRRHPTHGAAAGLCTLQANAQPLSDEDDPLPPLPASFVFFDIEARQDEGHHVANLLCAETSLNDQQHTFAGESCVRDFLVWLFRIVELDLEDENRPWIVVAHNFQGYDGYMILEELYNQNTAPKQISNGAKILSISLPNTRIKFIDSLNFFQMPLWEFPKTFGLTELKKGFFPHFFNTRENQLYQGGMPEKDHYDPRGMSERRRREFETWYAQQEADNYHFCFQDELLTYCQSDVRVLKQGCMTYMQLFESICGFNPMEHCITQASACSMAYRRNWMPKDSIAVEPLHGWAPPRGNQSKVALEWLHWLQRDHPSLLHADHEGEQTITVGRCTYQVDGYDPLENCIYEFHGCFWHGCTTCFPNRTQRHAKLDNATSHEVRERTSRRVQAFRDMGYPVVEQWECKWIAQKKADPDLRAFVKKLEYTTPLDPRDAFYGGRTETTRLLRETIGDEQIQYDDFTSLYPSCNKYCRYPLGHPEITRNPDTLTEQARVALLHRTFGLMKCKVLPPRQLYLPLLPTRTHGKLTFALCRTCVQTEMAKPFRERSFSCHHADKERAFVGTWCTPELEEALQLGYRLLHIYEVWHFAESSHQLFREYVDTFLKLKQEASGWPANVGDDETQRQAYLAEYLRHEGIHLEYSKIIKNPGMRSTAKAALNSFWGKFGQQPNKTQVTTCKTPKEFFQLFLDDAQDIHRIEFAGAEMVDVYHSHTPETVPVQTNTNIFIAAFTTCWARLKLYRECLQPLQERTLYMDTDSVIYVCSQSRQEPPLPRGNYLGDLTSELEEDDWIEDFVSGGPKNYAYGTRKGKLVSKARGFNKSLRTTEVVNFDSMKTLVSAELTDPQEAPRTLLTHDPHKIVRDSVRKVLLSKAQDKCYKLVYDKRVVDFDTLNTYPYGYLEDEEDMEL